MIGDTTVPAPGLLPYYQHEFFDTIKQVYQDSHYVHQGMDSTSNRRWTEVSLENLILVELSHSFQIPTCPSVGISAV